MVFIRVIVPHFLIVGTVYCRILSFGFTHSSMRPPTRRSSSAASRQKSLNV